MHRRLLTPEFVDGIMPPERGEIWIADTRVRGFGLRVWASKGPDFKAFAIRKNACSGGTIRKAFQPWRDGYRLFWQRPDWAAITDECGRVRLGALLEEARDWARDETDIVVGRRLSAQDQQALSDEHEQMRNHIGAVLSGRELGHLVEVLLRYGELRGWTEQYRDRLRHAFNLFDPDDKIRSMSVGELADGRIDGLIEQSNLSHANFRLLRSLLQTVFWNVHFLGGPAMGDIVPDQFRLAAQTKLANKFSAHSEISRSDVDGLLKQLRTSASNWRPRCCIALKCCFRAPISKVLSGRWSQIVDDLWFPYSPNERTHWSSKYERIDQSALDWLRLARESAASEGIESDFWFPRVDNVELPISSVDRLWRSLQEASASEAISLSKYASTVKDRMVHFEWPKRGDRIRIAKQLGSWPGTQGTAGFEDRIKQARW